MDILNSVISSREVSHLSYPQTVNVRKSNAIAKVYIPSILLLIIECVILISGFILIFEIIDMTGNYPEFTWQEYVIQSIVGAFTIPTSVFDLVFFSLVKAALVSILLGIFRFNYKIRRSAIPRFVIYATLLISVAYGLRKNIILYFLETENPALPVPLFWATLLTWIFTGFNAIESFLALIFIKKIVQILDFESMQSGYIATPILGPIEGFELQSQYITMKELVFFVAHEILWIICGMTTLLIHSATQLTIPYLIGNIVDALIKSSSNRDKLFHILFNLLTMFVVACITGFLRTFSFSVFGCNISKRFRNVLFESILFQDLEFFEQNSSKDLIDILSKDVQRIQQSASVGFSMLIRFFIQALGSGVIMWIINWKLALITFSCIPMLVLGSVMYGSYINQKQESLNCKSQELNNSARESINYIKTLKAHSIEYPAKMKFEYINEQSYLLGKDMGFIQSLFTGLTSILPQIAITFVVYYGVILVLNHELKVGSLVSFFLYMLTIAMSIGILGGLYGEHLQAYQSLLKIFQIIRRIPSIPLSSGGKIDNFKGHVSFQNVSYSSDIDPEENFLDNFTLTINAHENIVLFLTDDCGRNVFINLLFRFYDVSSGRIMLDWKLDIRLADPQWLRGEIGYVSYDPVIFNTSIRENIMYGWKKDTLPNESMIVNAAKMANAHDFIKSFSRGYDSIVGNQGQRLSPTQKQRLALARIFLMDPKILILDEAAAGLDAESENIIKPIRESLICGKTIILVTKSLRTLVEAKRIAVM